MIVPPLRNRRPGALRLVFGLLALTIRAIGFVELLNVASESPM